MYKNTSARTTASYSCIGRQTSYKLCKKNHLKRLYSCRLLPGSTTVIIIIIIIRWWAKQVDTICTNVTYSHYSIPCSPAVRVPAFDSRLAGSNPHQYFVWTNFLFLKVHHFTNNISSTIFIFMGAFTCTNTRTRITGIHNTITNTISNFIGGTNTNTKTNNNWKPTACNYSVGPFVSCKGWP